MQKYIHPHAYTHPYPQTYSILKSKNEVKNNLTQRQTHARIYSHTLIHLNSCTTKMCSADHFTAPLPVAFACKRRREESLWMNIFIFNYLCTLYVYVIYTCTYIYVYRWVNVKKVRYIYKVVILILEKNVFSFICKHIRLHFTHHFKFYLFNLREHKQAFVRVYAKVFEILKEKEKVMNKK